MISFRRLAILPGVVLMLASAAFAQTGTITVSGTTPEAFSMTNTSGNTLSATIAFNVMTPANSTTVVSDEAIVRMRSNKAYKVSAQAAALNITGPGAADGGDTIALSDFGFGITQVVTTGGNVATPRTDTVAPNFSVTSWPAATNGLTPSFTRRLSDIAAPASIDVLSGTRISKKGNLATDDNFIEVKFGVATLPQFFTPNTGFSTIITLTMASQ